MKPSVYLDTSALAKWYLNEPLAEDFEAFLLRQRAPAISRLAVVEFRCLLGGRRRAGEFNTSLEKRILAAFQDDLGRGLLYVHPLQDRHAIEAVSVLARLGTHSLRTLDALHLAVACEMRVPLLATADRIMAHAAEALGIEVARFYG